MTKLSCIVKSVVVLNLTNLLVLTNVLNQVKGAAAMAPGLLQSESFIQILAPAAGETLWAGEQQVITWRSRGDFQFVRIEYSLDNGVTWSSLKDHTTRSGSYEWSVPDRESDACLLRITPLPGQGSFLQSKSPFAIARSRQVSGPLVPKKQPLATGTAAIATIRIMPLGDSITEGIHGSTDNAGYRNDLAAALDSANILYDMVGSKSSGTGFDSDHEGHSGFRADELLAQLNTYLSDNPPDMVLLHIGTNDITELQSPSSTIDEISALLDTIQAFDDSTKIILSSVIPRTDSENSANDALNTLIDSLFAAKQSEGYAIFFADNHGAFVANPNWEVDYMDDTVHPNDAGYAVMGDVWLDAILTALSGAQDLQLTLPNGCETLLAGSSQNITYFSTGLFDGVDLEFSSDGGATWSTVATSTANDGSFSWTVPVLSSEDCWIRIFDTADGTPMDTSDALFAISENNSGKFALRFDGHDDFVEIADAPALSGGAGKSLTVEAWVFLKTTAGQQPVVSKLKDSQWKDWSLVVNDGQLLVAIENNGDNWETAAGSVTAGTWTHVAFTFDNGSDVVRLYLDGQQVGSDAVLSKDMPDTDAPVLIGKNFYLDFFLDGFVEEVRIWDHVRTATELQDNLNLILAGTEPGLIAYWRFDQGSGQVAADNSGNSHDGDCGATANLESDDPIWVLSDAPLTTGSLDSVSDLAASNTGTAVSLQWSSVAGATEYRVYRATTAYFDTAGLAPIATATTTSFNDNDDDVANNVLGDSGSNYFYGVAASDGITTAALSNRVGEFDFALDAGFSFMALALSDTSIGNAEDLGLALDAQVGGNGATAVYQMASGSWQLMAFKSAGAWILTVTDSLVVGNAYLVNLDTGGTWTVVGGLEPDLSHSLAVGFNTVMLPFAKADADSIVDAADLGASLDAGASAEGASAIYQMVGGSWQLMAFKAGGAWIVAVTDPVVAGLAYLVNMSESVTW